MDILGDEPSKPFANHLTVVLYSPGSIIYWSTVCQNLDFSIVKLYQPINRPFYPQGTLNHFPPKVVPVHPWVTVGSLRWPAAMAAIYRERNWHWSFPVLPFYLPGHQQPGEQPIGLICLAAWRTRFGVSGWVSDVFFLVLIHTLYLLASHLQPCWCLLMVFELPIDKEQWAISKKLYWVAQWLALSPSSKKFCWFES